MLRCDALISNAWLIRRPGPSDNHAQLMFVCKLFPNIAYHRFLGEMQRIAFRLLLSSCVCVCVYVCRVCGPQEDGMK